MVEMPEERARHNIDTLLGLCGWIVQDKSDVNLSAGRGIAIREVSVKRGHGEADYLLFADGKAIGTVEAKPEGWTLHGVEEQSAKYTTGLPSNLPAWCTPLPFCYESTGIETHFTNKLDPAPRSRSVFAFQRPEMLIDWVKQRLQVNERLRQLPPLVSGNLWPAQIVTITNLEKSLAANKPRSLIQMVSDVIEKSPRRWTTEKLWQVYEKLDKSKVRGSGRRVLADIVSLVRFALNREGVLIPFGGTARKRFVTWINQQESHGRRFTPEQKQWLELIRDHIATSLSIETDDFELSPFNQKGGLGKVHQLFGDDLNPLLEELNEALAA